MFRESTRATGETPPQRVEPAWNSGWLLGFSNNVYDPAFAWHGLYGIKIGSRVVGIISLSGLQCGWDGMIAPPGYPVARMKMLVNIYVYAMLQSG